MGRCQHCKNLTHTEHLDVYYCAKDHEKVFELTQMKDWTPKFMYNNNDERINNNYEYGKLRVGDIVIHFIAKSNEEKLDWANPIVP